MSDAFDAMLEDDDLDNDGRGAAQRLLDAIERVERIDEEIDGLRDDRKDIFAELKAAGFEVAVVRKIIARRKLDRETRQEQDEILKTYEEALGL